MLLLLAIGAFDATMIGVSAADSPAIYVDPPSTIDPALTPPDPYTIAIKTDYDGTDVWGWQFTLSFNPSVLKCIAVDNGDLITTAKDPTAEFIPPLVIDNTDGTISLTIGFFAYMSPPIPVTYGPGTLATVTFEVFGIGSSDIILGEETQLHGSDGTNTYIIINGKYQPTHLGHGYFDNSGAELEPPVAVISAPSTATVGELVTFDGSGSSDVDGTIVSYSWDFETPIRDRVKL